ncbi:MAG TPA: CoA-binding protein, partial [Mycobacterium sp.]|nr:CoA-binding protein [Mycobacterium sp.]
MVGAGRGELNIGHTVVRNLLRGRFKGPIYPVNPSAATIEGIACAPTIEAVEGPVDLAVLAVPAEQCLDVVEACARKGVRGLVVISSGFAEAGDAGAALQSELLRRAHRGGMRIVGPNCFGVINTAPDVCLDATFSAQQPESGRIAFASQSGALGIAVLEQSLTTSLRLSSFVSMGNKCDVSSNDLLRYWSQDNRTRAILLYLESFGNPRAFARVAPIVSRSKPIVVVKSGRSTAGTRAAASHTAALASSDIVVDALFLQAGVIRVDTLEELLDCGELLGSQPDLRGRRIAIIGNAGGAAVLAADACAGVGLVVPEFDDATQLAVRKMAGPNASVSNPVDLGAGASPLLFGSVLQIAFGCPTIDGAIVILAPVASAAPEDVASAVAAVAGGERPIVFVHLGKAEALAALSTGANPIPCYAFPERAVRALGHVADHSDWMQRSVGRVPDLDGVDLAAGRSIVDAYLSHERDGGWLPFEQTVDLLCAFGIPTVDETRAMSPAEAVAAAGALGGAVALKAFGDRIVHKSDIGA